MLVDHFSHTMMNHGLFEFQPIMLFKNKPGSLLWLKSKESAPIFQLVICLLYNYCRTDDVKEMAWPAQSIWDNNGRQTIWWRFMSSHTCSSRLSKRSLDIRRYLKWLSGSHMQPHLLKQVVIFPLLPTSTQKRLRDCSFLLLLLRLRSKIINAIASASRSLVLIAPSPVKRARVHGRRNRSGRSGHGLTKI